jgi:hypothetical protein
MKPRDPARRKRGPRLFGVRTALIVLLAVFCGLGGAVLLYAAHRSLPLAVFSGLGVLGLAVKFSVRLWDFCGDRRRSIGLWGFCGGTPSKRARPAQPCTVLTVMPIPKRAMTHCDESSGLKATRSPITH